jgi:outer membrane protein assembly factor BamB
MTPLFNLRLALAMAGVVALTACKGETVVEPAVDGGVMVVIAGRVTTTDGLPAVGTPVEIIVPCLPTPTTCRRYASAATDETGRFMRSFQEDGPPFGGPADVIARPHIGQGYSLGMTQQTVEVSFQPVPPADTTFVELQLPPNESDSRRPLWVQHISFRAMGRPLRADGGNVYASTPGGIAAMDPETGGYLWEKGASGGLAGFPYVVVGGVVVIAGNDVLIGIRSSTGDPLWTRQSVPSLALTTNEPDQLFATDGESITAYDPQTGATRWVRPLPPGGSVSIGVGDGVVCAERRIVSPDVASIECWSASQGESLWSRVIAEPTWLVVTDERVVLPAGETPGETGWIALDARTGATIWKSNLPSTHSPAISKEGGRLYTCTREGTECFAIQTTDGMTVWRKSFDDAVGSPAIGIRNVYVVANVPDPASLLVLDVDTGEIRERIDPDPLDPYGFCGVPAAYDDMVFVFGCWGYVYAFRVGP